MVTVRVLHTAVDIRSDPMWNTITMHNSKQSCLAGGELTALALQLEVSRGQEVPP